LVPDFFSQKKFIIKNYGSSSESVLVGFSSNPKPDPVFNPVPVWVLEIKPGSNLAFIETETSQTR
jgi:hypothetical protein